MLIAGFPAGSLAANCYVIAAHADGDCLVIDPGEDAAARLDATLTEHRLTPAAVLLTHGHIDHLADASVVCQAYDIPAYLHSDDQYMLDDPAASLGSLAALLDGTDVSHLRPSTVESPLGTLEVAGLAVRVDHTPGHTGGSAVYRIDAAEGQPELLFTGDTLFAGSIGRSDLPGGSSSTLLQSIRTRLLSRPDDAIVAPGHGPTSTIGAERRTNPFLT